MADKTNRKMETQFVPYELAVKLKELGFDEGCFGFYTELENLVIKENVKQQNCATGKFVAPLWQQAFDFLLKKYNLYGVLIPTATMYWAFKTMTVIEHIVEVPPYNNVDGSDYPSIGEARQACLEKLIELITNK